MRTLTYRARFESDKFRISSTLYTCKHGKHYEVELTYKEDGHKHIVAHTHSYREHWAQMYEASERYIL